MIIKYRKHIEALGIFLCTLFLFTWGVSEQEIIGFESRFYLFALEMWRNGISWFPTTYNQPYPDYPGTFTWLIYICALLFGGMNKLAAVLPTALASAAILVLTYLTGALHHKKWGLYAVFFLFMTVFFLKSARSISLDIYPTLATIGCFYCIHHAYSTSKSLAAFWVVGFLLLGFLFRGPIGLIIPVAVICIYCVLERDLRKCIYFGMCGLALLLICTSALLLIADHAGGNTFAQTVLQMQVLGRINDSHQSAFFYFANSVSNYAITFPLAGVVLMGFIKRYRRTHPHSELQFLLHLFGWVAIVMIGMSIPGDKKIRYILPITPALALIAAYPFVTASNHPYFSIVRQAVWYCFLWLPTFLIFLTCVLWVYLRQQDMSSAISMVWNICFFVFLQLSNFIFVWRYPHYRDTSILFSAALCFFSSYINIVEPIELYIDRGRDFVTQVETMRMQANAALVFYGQGQDGLPIKYLINMPKRTPLYFIYNPNVLLHFKEKAFFVTDAWHHAKFSTSVKEDYKIVMNGILGHNRVVVFTKAEEGE